MSIKNFFALIFIISLSVFLYTKFYLEFKSVMAEDKIVKEEPITQTYTQKSLIPSISIENNFSTNKNFILISSLIASILSFFGFIISSYYAKRDEELFNLRKEKERLEMEKLQEEIRALQRGEI